MRNSEFGMRNYGVAFCDVFVGAHIVRPWTVYVV